MKANNKIWEEGKKRGQDHQVDSIIYQDLQMLNDDENGSDGGGAQHSSLSEEEKDGSLVLDDASSH